MKKYCADKECKDFCVYHILKTDECVANFLCVKQRRE